jgi:WD40 repeat protein
MNLEVEKVAHLKGHNGGIYSFAPYVNQTFFAASSDRFVSQWSLIDFTNTGFNIQLPSQAYSLCLLHHKEVMFIGTFSGDIHVVDLQTRREMKMLRNHQAAILSIAHNNDLTCVVAASSDGSISCIELENFTTINVIKLCNEKVRSVRAYGHHDFIIASGDGMVRIINDSDFHISLGYFAHELSANISVLDPSKEFIISGGRDAHIKKYSLTQHQILQDIPAHNYAIYDLLCIPELQLMVSASRDKTIKIWDLESLDFLLRINKENYDAHMNSVNCLLFFQGLLISGSDDRSIMVWRLKK